MWTLIAGVLALLYLLYSWPRLHLYKAAYHLPGPPVLPFIGNLLSSPSDPVESYTSFVNMVKKYGTVIRFWAGHKLYIILTDPQDAQTILGNSKARNKDSWVAAALGTFVGKGILTSQGETWKTHRRLVTPAFASKILKVYVGVFGRQSGLLVEKLESLANGGTINIHHHINLLTADTICETVLGTSVRFPMGTGNQLYDALQLGSKLVMRRMSSPWLLIDWIYQYTSDGKKARELRKKLNDMCFQVISEKLEAFRRNGATGGDDTFKTFIDVVIETLDTEGALMTPQQIADEVCTLAVAAVETTSAVTSTFTTLMGIHQEIQDQVVTEMEDIFGEDRRLPTLDDLNRMVTLERCIKETLRLFPVGHLLPREVNEDTKISKGITVPRGCVAMVFAHGVHHDVRNYPDPLMFLPDRWLPENSEGRHPYAFLPFGAGLRNCIGQKYAMLQMKTTLSSILRRFRITTNTTLKDLLVIKFGSIAESVCGFNIALTKRARHEENKNLASNVTKL